MSTAILNEPRQVYKRFSRPSESILAKEAFVISPIVLQPVNCIQRRKSLCIVSSIRFTPVSPSYYEVLAAYIDRYTHGWRSY